MSKSLAASQDLMKTYLSELLTEEDKVFAEPPSASEKVLEGQKLEKLLQKVNVADKPAANRIVSRKSEKSPVIETPVEPSKPAVAEPIEKPLVAVKPPIKRETIATRKSQKIIPAKKDAAYRSGSFQAMFFDVAGLTIAVPLIELGGIYNVSKTNSLVGKPEWFKGVMIHREDQINVVDTALWVMPEKCDQALKDSLNYKYVIMLSQSKWGVLAENLVDTVTLQQEDVKWLDDSRKRPWLAGLVKDRMCALLEVDAFIQLLEEGMNINQE